jgi:hypothetical protein
MEPFSAMIRSREEEEDKQILNTQGRVNVTYK